MRVMGNTRRPPVKATGPDQVLSAVAAGVAIPYVKYPWARYRIPDAEFAQTLSRISPTNTFGYALTNGTAAWVESRRRSMLSQWRLEVKPLNIVYTAKQWAALKASIDE